MLAFKQLSWLPLISLCCLPWTSARGQNASPATKGGVRAEAQILALSPKVARVGDRVTVTVRIKNVGKVPFYISNPMQMDSYRGGFLLVVTPPPGASVIGESGWADPVPGSRPDALTEAKELYLQLSPGAFYGGELTLPVIPMSPGKYKIELMRVPPGLSDETRGQIQDVLKGPVLSETVVAQPMYLQVSGK
jgi:hypothetical protein